MALAPQDPRLLLGKTLGGRYRLDALLGEGGAGNVYRAVPLEGGRQVAVKVLHGDSSDPSASERFEREAEALRSLHHPNIVEFIDFGRDGQSRWVAMEYCPGVDIFDLIQAGRLPEEHALEVARQVCLALAEPHAAGIVHRDLKPANLRIVADASGGFDVKLLDFGFALMMDEDLRLTEEGQAPGTMAYMPPEQLRGLDLDTRGDLYALGVILFEMLTGLAPFRHENPIMVGLGHLEEIPPAPSELLPLGALHEGVDALVLSLLRKAPERRPQTAGAVALTIEALRARHGLAAPMLRTDTAELRRAWGLLPKGQPPAADPDDHG